jgi:hypothetical protein
MGGSGTHNHCGDLSRITSLLGDTKLRDNEAIRETRLLDKRMDGGSQITYILGPRTVWVVLDTPNICSRIPMTQAADLMILYNAFIGFTILHDASTNDHDPIATFQNPLRSCQSMVSSSLDSRTHIGIIISLVIPMMFSI